MQMASDEWAPQHAKPSPILGLKDVTNTSAIGIELMNSSDGVNANRVQRYTGRQVAALVQLVDFLIRRYQLNPNPIVRPAGWKNGGYDQGDVVTHAVQRGRLPLPTGLPPGNGCERKDPAGPFRSDLFCPHLGSMVSSPTIEEVVYQALAKNHSGLITFKGGDGFGEENPGNGGKVSITYGANSPFGVGTDQASDLIVRTGESATLLTAPKQTYGHILVDGILHIPTDVDLTVGGVLYVGPNGKIDGAGYEAHPNGMNIIIHADGFALVEGTIDLSGFDRKGAPGAGGNGGSLTFESSSAGPAHILSIVTRGGDASIYS